MAEIDDDKTMGEVPLIEETISIDKKRVARGSVQVRSLTGSFEQKVEAVLRGDANSVTRVPIGREVDVVPQVRIEGDLTIVPILEEILVVEKRLVLKEEIHIRRISETDHFESHVTLRRQRAVVERQNAAGEPLREEPTKATKG